MRTVARDRDRAAEVARRGQEDVTRQLSAEACGARIVARLRTLAHAHPSPTAPAPALAVASNPTR